MKNMIKSLLIAVCMISAVSVSAQEPAPAAKASDFSVGDTIVIKKDHERYLTGEKMSKWVYDVEHTIQQVGGRRFPEGILIRGIISWVGPDDIINKTDHPEETAAQQQAKEEAAAQQQAKEEAAAQQQAKEEAAAQQQAKEEAAKQAAEQQKQEQQQAQSEEQQSEPQETSNVVVEEDKAPVQEAHDSEPQQIQGEEPAYVIGDGLNTIRQLIKTENKRRKELKKISETALCPIVIDEHVKKYLKEEGKSLDCIPSKNEKVYLRLTSNIAKGGVSHNMTKEVHPSAIEIAKKVASIIPLPFMGIDFVTEDITKPQTHSSYSILEVNSSPGFAMHMLPAIGEPVDVGEYAIKVLF